MKDTALIEGSQLFKIKTCSRVVSLRIDISFEDSQP